jgi:hypothetical protein
MTINNKFDIGDHVYVITDKEQDVGIITGILINPRDVIYFVSRDNDLGKFYDFELSKDENKILRL